MIAEVVDHGSRLDFPEAFKQRWVCLGYRFECADGVIAFSGDTVDCPGLRRLAANADILVHCCYLARAEIDTPQTRRLAEYTLACADTVGRIATEANVGTLVLTHPSAEIRRADGTDARGRCAGFHRPGAAGLRRIACRVVTPILPCQDWAWPGRRRRSLLQHRKSWMSGLRPA